MEAAWRRAETGRRAVRRYPFARMDAIFEWLRAAFLTVLRCAVFALLLLAATGVCGCGSALEAHTVAHGTSRRLHTGAVQALREAIRADLAEACAGSSDVDACVDARSERWETAETAANASADAHDAWALALYTWAVRAGRGETSEDEPPPGVCELGQRAIDLALRIAAEYAPNGLLDDVTISLGCDR